MMNMLLKLSILLLAALVSIGVPSASHAADSPGGEAASAVNELAFKLYRECAPDGANFCVSPYSISSAFAMLYAGARGETAAEMERALGCSPTIHDSMRALMSGITDIPDEAADVYVGNSLWPKYEFRIKSDYTSLLERCYGAEVRPLDYAARPESSRLRINDWVDEHTRGKIKDILGEGAVGPDTSLVLVNAVYFRSGWLDEFPASATAPRPFAAPNGERSVDMMERTGRILYGASEGMRAVKLLYRYGLFSMTVILPEDGRDISEVESSLDASTLASLDASLDRREVELRLPKFKVESGFDLADAMRAIGANAVFTPKSADLSGIDGERDLFVSSAVHKAVIEVDEKGTEAAAATAIGLRTTSFMEPEPPVLFHADRPFVYVVRSEATGAVLFMGRVLEP